MRALSVVFALSLLALLAAGAWMGPGGAFETPPVIIVSEPLHIGDNTVESFQRKEPDGLEATRDFDLPHRLEHPCLVMRLHHVVPGDRKEFLQGAYHDILELNGKKLVTLNTLVPREKGGVFTVFVPVPPKLLKEGTNHLTVRAGKSGTNHDDFEWGPVQIGDGCRVSVRVEEEGDLVPARLQVLDGKGERTLSFGPKPRGEGAGHVILAPGGEAEVFLPRGEPFDIQAFRGMEYTAPRERILPEEAEISVTLDLQRVVDTAGWISGDFHLHADPSGDSRVLLKDRVASLIAGGVEFAVATDHNRITDYAPAVAALRANRWLATAAGDEITTRNPRMGHFNAFPLKTGLPPVPFERMTPEKLFATARREYGAQVIQVNHPRSRGMDYFGIFHFDGGRGAGGEGYSADFDAVEVFNGLTPMEETEAVLLDWFSILKYGKRVVATGNSDSHAILYQDAGYPRNFVQVGGDDPKGLTVGKVAQAIRKGRVIVSSGPFVEAWVGEKGIGETASLPPGKVLLRVRVQAAPWVEVDTLEVVLNGDVVRRLPVPKSEEVSRFDQEIPLEVKEDGFVVVLARGKGYRAPALTQGRLAPLAFTNPIWIDVED